MYLHLKSEVVIYFLIVFIILLQEYYENKIINDNFLVFV